MSILLKSQIQVYNRYAITKKFTAQETEIKMTQGKISLLVSESEITELKNGNKTMYSRLVTTELNLNSITLAVSSSKYKTINGVLNAVTQAEASITLHSNQIALKVSKDSVISSINQTSESVKINANKIALTGNGIISIINTGTTTINAAKINLNGVVTANENFKILADGSMVAKNGTFRGAIASSSASITGGTLNINNNFTVDEIGNFKVAGFNLFTYRLFDYSPLFGATVHGGGMYFGEITNSKQEVASCIENSRLYLGISGTPEIGYHGSIRVSSLSGELAFSIEGTSIIASKECTMFFNGMAIFRGRVSIENTLVVDGNFAVKGNKNRAVMTNHYGMVAQSAYETCEPMFGDLGHGVINENGMCVVFIDPKFGETISTEYGYYVFITKYSDGDIWVESKDYFTFTLCGTPGLEFDWEIKAHQKGFETERLKNLDAELVAHM